MSYDIGKRVYCDHLDRYGNDYKNEVSACPKCVGNNYYYDFAWSFVDGFIEKVEDLTLLQELCLKAVLTVKGDNTFHPEYGTSITPSVAAPTASFEAVQGMIEKEVSLALASIKARQDFQLTLGQDLSGDERIYTLNKLEVAFIDERTLSVNIYVTTESGKNLTFAV